MSGGRTVKNVSFAANEYERGLLAHAIKPEHGPFSQYVKRLIEADRRGGAMASNASTGVILPPTPPAPKSRANGTDKSAARSFF